MRLLFKDDWWLETKTQGNIECLTSMSSVTISLSRHIFNPHEWSGKNHQFFFTSTQGCRENDVLQKETNFSKDKDTLRKKKMQEVG